MLTVRTLCLSLMLCGFYLNFKWVNQNWSLTLVLKFQTCRKSSPTTGNITSRNTKGIKKKMTMARARKGGTGCFLLWSTEHPYSSEHHLNSVTCSETHSFVFIFRTAGASSVIDVTWVGFLCIFPRIWTYALPAPEGLRRKLIHNFVPEKCTWFLWQSLSSIVLAILEFIM